MPRIVNRVKQPVCKVSNLGSNWLHCDFPRSMQSAGYSKLLDTSPKNGDVFNYVIESGDDWEYGTCEFYYSDLGLYNASSVETLWRHYGNQSSWSDEVVDFTAFGGMSGWVVFSKEVDLSGTAYLSDTQLDKIQLPVRGVQTTDALGNPKKLYDFGNTTDGVDDVTGWYTSTAGGVGLTTITYSNTYRADLAVGTTGERWNIDAGGTSSSNTALSTDADGSTSGYYVYAETSSPTVSGDNFYLLKYVTIPDNPPPLKFSFANSGSAAGWLAVQFAPRAGGHGQNTSHPLIKRTPILSSLDFYEPTGEANDGSSDGRWTQTVGSNNLSDHPNYLLTTDMDAQTNPSTYTGDATIFFSLPSDDIRLSHGFRQFMATS